MMDQQTALGGRGTDLFGGIPVADFPRALDWYTRLFGVPPSFFPNDREAVWQIGERHWLYIIVDAGRAGRAIQTLMCDDLDGVIASIATRGLAYDDEERPAENVRKVMYHDPDGNEIGLGSVPKE